MLSANFRILSPISQARGPEPTGLPLQRRGGGGRGAGGRGTSGFAQAGSASKSLAAHTRMVAGSFPFLGNLLATLRRPAHSCNFYCSPGVFCFFFNKNRPCVFKICIFARPGKSVLVNDCQAVCVFRDHVTRTRDLERLWFSFVSEGKDQAYYCTKSLCSLSVQRDSGRVTPRAAALALPPPSTPTPLSPLPQRPASPWPVQEAVF